LAAESAKERVALLAATAVGLNVTETEQLPPPAGRVLPVQVSEVVEKSPGLAPAIDTPDTIKAPLAGLVTVTDCGALVVLTVWLPKARLEALRFAEPERPVPERGMSWEPALSVTCRVAVRGPAAVGLNVTASEQVGVPVSFVVSDAEAQPLLEIWKSPGFDPVSVKLPKVRVATPFEVATTF
jgi:hypothetical protein